LRSRRSFIGHLAGGLAGTLASPVGVLGAQNRIQVGILGFGERGLQLARELQSLADVRLAAVADVYTRRLDTARGVAPGAQLYDDPRRLLDDRDVDAVVIATPQHLHACQVIDCLKAGKHVYVEKTLALTVADARSVLEMCRKAPQLKVQVGHQWVSSGLMEDALRFLAAGGMGQITAIHAHMYRNAPFNKPHWRRPIYPDMTPESIAWESFLGPAQRRAFDAERFANWRLYWDYSGGSVFENLSQQLAFWYKALKLDVPLSVCMFAGASLWQDGREIPDTMSVVMRHTDGLLFSWDSGFGNNQLGLSEEVLGTEGTICRSQQIRYIPQKVNRPDGLETMGFTRSRPNAHMCDFLDSIRTGRAPACPPELGYRVAVACAMAIESLRQGRTVSWDPEKQEIL